MRKLILLMPLLVGCATDPPGPVVVPLVVSDVALSTIAVCCAEEEIGVPDLSKPIINDQKIQVGKCTACDGKGMVGDSVVMQKCLRCNGDGRIDEADIGKRSDDTLDSAKESASNGQRSHECDCVNCTCNPCRCQAKSTAKDEPTKPTSSPDKLLTTANGKKLRQVEKMVTVRRCVGGICVQSLEPRMVWVEDLSPD